MDKVAHPRDTEAPYLIGGVVSIIGHICLGLTLLISFPRFGDFGKPMVYSVSIEGGKKLGGIQQLSQSDKTTMAPAKNVSSSEAAPKEEAKKDEKNLKSEKEAKDEAKDAEVSLHEKEKKAEPTAKPTEAPKKAEPTPKPEKGKGGKGEDEDAKDKQKNLTLSKAEDKQLEKAMQRYLGESSDAGGQGFGAAALGAGNGMGGGIVRPPEFFIYLDLLKKHLLKGWRWPGSASIKAVMVFELSPEGRISNISVFQSSGVSDFDDSAYRAILKANPAPPPPPTVYEFFKQVRVIFDPKEQG